jgi:large subunit ribosomal protein L25
MLHEVEIRCLAISIPEKLELSIRNLELGKSLHVSDITLPEKVVMLTDPHLVTVTCFTVAVEQALGVGATAGTEPEVVAKAKTKDGEAAG